LARAGRGAARAWARGDVVTRLGPVALGLLAFLGPARASSPEAGAARTEARVVEARGKRVELVERLIARWPRASRKAARAVMEKYGPPHMITHKSLLWIGNAPWKGTVVYRAGAFPASPRAERRVLRQFVAYRVPPEKAGALARLDMGVAADFAQGELAAESDTEEENFLALNMADDVVTERIGVDEARRLYAKTLSLAMSGKSSAAMQGLLFARRPGADCGGPDTARTK
jgi:hypothetical protein